MYSLNCNYYYKTFESINELVKGVVEDGQDPNYEILKNGKGIGEELVDFIVY